MPSTPAYAGFPANLDKIQQLAAVAAFHPGFPVNAHEAAGHGQVPEQFKVGDLVWATESFSTDSEEAALLTCGQKGTVILIDDDGDAYIQFDNVSKKQWVYKQNHVHLSKAPPVRNSGRQEAAAAAEGAVTRPPFRAGDMVIVTEDFITDSEEPVELEAGREGSVVEIDGDGDAYILFQGLSSKQWVYSANFGYLAKMDPMTSSLLQEAEQGEPFETEDVDDVDEVTEQAPGHFALWQFQPPEDRVIALRAGPDLNAERQGGVLQPGETFGVSEEYRGPDGILYLQLADSRGWIFEGRPGVGTLCRRLEQKTFEEEPADVAVPVLQAEPFTLERAKELLLRIQEAVSASEFQRWLEGARKSSRQRPPKERTEALHSRLRVLFTKACGGMATEFGFGSNRKGFGAMFIALQGFCYDTDVFQLAMQIEASLGVKPGAWFSMDPLREGATAYVCGLESAPYLNGTAGVLEAFDPAHGRWRVRLAEEEQVMLLLPTNLSAQPPSEEEGSEDEDDSWSEVPWWVSAGKAAAAKAAKNLARQARNVRAIEWKPIPTDEQVSLQDQALDTDRKPPALFHMLEEIDRQEEEQLTKEAWADLAKPSSASLVLALEDEEEDPNLRKSSFEVYVPKLGGLDVKKFKEVATWGARKDAGVVRTTGNWQEGDEAILTVEERGLLTPEHMTPLKQLQAWKEKQNRPHPKSVGLMPKRTPLGFGADRRQGDIASMPVGSAASSSSSSGGGFARPAAGAGLLPPFAPPMRPRPPPPRSGLPR